MTIRKGYVDTRDGQVHYRVCPGAGPALVFLHKTASSSAMWEQVMRALSGRYHMVALDTPGFGGSFDPVDVPDVGYYCEVFTQALDGLGLERFHLCGHHTGASAAVQMAAQAPARVRSLAMFGPVQMTAGEREAFRERFSGAIFPRADGGHLQETWDYLAALGADRSLELHHRELLDTVRAWRGRAMAYAAVWEQDFPALYAQVACPVLLMAARDDVLWPFLERARAEHPGARAVAVDGANFEPDLDPEGVVAALRNFLARTEP
ncbi:MAG TPA: alpha/beta hydrolase [Gammaproteobacteria bacterium]|nr:alpha/beta hydrolase [Gammaproteobacteria bacterium]